MSISAVAALLLPVRGTARCFRCCAREPGEIEPRQLDHDPLSVEPPVVVPTSNPSNLPRRPHPQQLVASRLLTCRRRPDDIVVTARGEAPPGDPLQEVNITSYRVVQSVDKALVAPVATGYQGIVPNLFAMGLAMRCATSASRSIS